jgi:hypothetical protein
VVITGGGVQFEGRQLDAEPGAGRIIPRMFSLCRYGFEMKIIELNTDMA